MKHRSVCTVVAVLSLLASMAAQTMSNSASQATSRSTAVATNAAAAQVPRLVKFSSTIPGFNANEAQAEAAARDGVSAGSGAPTGAVASVPSKVVGMTFSLYSEQTGGVPLWSEVQNVQVDQAGHYTVQLGATQPEGLPVELFASAQAQWLGVRQEGQTEQPRVMMLSVPYALKAADAETFGGKPPSAYMSAPASAAGVAAGVSGIGSVQTTNGKSSPAVGGGGTTNYIPVWTSSSNLGSSVIYQSGDNIGIGTTSPPYSLSVKDSVNESAIVGQEASRQGVAIGGNATGTGGIGVQGVSDSSVGFGVYGADISHAGSGVGVLGTTDSPTGVGVYGKGNSTTGANFGVEGETASPDGVAVGGSNSGTTGNAIGVSGESDSTSGIGVLGNAFAETGANFGVKGATVSTGGVGVYAVSNATSGTNYALETVENSPDGAAIFANNASTTGNAVGTAIATQSSDGYAVLAVGINGSKTTVSESPVGLWGATNQNSGVGVVGTNDNGIAVEGANNADNIATGLFENNETTDFQGPVLIAHGTGYDGTCLMDVSGNLDCTGSKSAVVPVDAGSRMVALYAVEAPDNWFEDIGSGQLANGSAVVQLEPTFAQTVNSGVEYHVFLTPNGDCKGLYVANKSASSFEVRELGGGKASIGFDYRIIARRKGYERIRMADKTKVFSAVKAHDQLPHRPAPPVAKIIQSSSTVPKLRSSAAVPNVLVPALAPAQHSTAKAHN